MYLHWRGGGMASSHSDAVGTSGAYVSPIVDFVGFSVVTLVGAAALAVLLL